MECVLRVAESGGAGKRWRRVGGVGLDGGVGRVLAGGGGVATSGKGSEGGWGVEADAGSPKDSLFLWSSEEEMEMGGC